MINADPATAASNSRRSPCPRDTLIVAPALAGFSARKVARPIGYSNGTIHNLLGRANRLIAAINTRSFAARAGSPRERPVAAGSKDGRIAVLMEG